MWAVFLAVTKDLLAFVLEVLSVTAHKSALVPIVHTSNGRLSSLKYILFRLNIEGRNPPPIDPTSQREFLYETLRGQPGVRINITPRAHAIMEVFDEQHHSQLLFVERLNGDDSLTVSSVGWQRENEFRLDTLSKSKWQEWRPVFINIESP